MGPKGSRFIWSGRETDRKRFFAGEKSPFTNTAKSSLFCSRKVNISLLFTEDLQNGEILGEDRINSGFYWGSETGIYCVNLWSPGGVAESPGVTVCTARRRGLPFAPAKGSKTGSRGRFPLDKPLFVACSAGYERCEASSVLRTDTLPR